MNHFAHLDIEMLDKLVISHLSKSTFLNPIILCKYLNDNVAAQVF